MKNQFHIIKFKEIKYRDILANGKSDKKDGVVYDKFKQDELSEAQKIFQGGSYVPKI